MVISFYRLALYLFLPVLLMRLVLRGFSNPGYWRRWRERFALDRKSLHPADLWVHAVSVGEVRAASPLILAILERSPGLRVVVTTMTPTGADQLRKSLQDKVRHCYAPYDYPGAVARFLARVRPSLLIVLETEIWPNIVTACHRHDTPVIFTNARMSARSHRGYRYLQSLIGPVLAKISGFGVQSQADAERLIDLGALASRVTVTGSIKFEVQLSPSLREVALVERRQWGSAREVWVAGSTHDGEEEMLLAVYDTAKRQHPKLLLVLAPRHPERFAAVVRLCRRAGYAVVRRTEQQGAIPHNTDIYVADTMGELPMFYSASDVAYVGGSWTPVGGHNILEVCAVGVPVLFGPYMFNFSEISKIVLQREAGRQVKTPNELAAALHEYLDDANLRFATGEAGRVVVEENRGALQHTQTLLEPYLREVVASPKHSPGRL